jgi:CheY-like chemotaxis protein
MTKRASGILVVDDDHDIRTCVAEILSDAGYAVRAAAHGAEALALLRGGFQPSLILLDLMMPVMDGVTLCDRLAADPGLAAIPIVIISADADAASKATACAAAGLLRKPVRLNDLLATAARYAAPSIDRNS